jgi:hypothetical protein
MRKPPHLCYPYNGLCNISCGDDLYPDPRVEPGQKKMFRLIFKFLLGVFDGVIKNPSSLGGVGGIDDIEKDHLTYTRHFGDTFQTGRRIGGEVRGKQHL